MDRTSLQGKTEFYPKAEEALKAVGYTYYKSEEIETRSHKHARKPDYIAVDEKEGIVIIGEIKSPKEGPTTSSWRQVQNNDSRSMKDVREWVRNLEKEKRLSPNIGGHIIILKGQIPDYVQNLNKTFTVKDLQNKKIIGGYTVPSSEKENVRAAFEFINENYLKIINTQNGTVTFLFEIRSNAPLEGC